MEHPLENVSEKNLSTLFELHDRLMDVSERINDIYSANMVVFVTVSFISTMFGIVFESKELFYQFEGDDDMSYSAASYVVWAIPSITLIFLLLHACENTRQVAYDASLCVHKIIQKRPIFMLDSEFFYSKMKAFSLQMLHRKKTFNFNGQGLFNFDYTFIFSVRLQKHQYITLDKSIIATFLICMFFCFIF